MLTGPEHRPSPPGRDSPRGVSRFAGEREPASLLALSAKLVSGRARTTSGDQLTWTGLSGRGATRDLLAGQSWLMIRRPAAGPRGDTSSPGPGRRPRSAAGPRRTWRRCPGHGGPAGA